MTKNLRDKLSEVDKRIEEQRKDAYLEVCTKEYESAVGQINSLFKKYITEKNFLGLESLALAVGKLSEEFSLTQEEQVKVCEFTYEIAKKLIEEDKTYEEIKDISINQYGEPNFKKARAYVSNFKRKRNSNGEDEKITRGNCDNLPEEIQKDIIEGKYNSKSAFKDVLEGKATLEDIKACYMDCDRGKGFGGIIRGYRNLTKKRKKLESQGNPLEILYGDGRGVVSSNRQSAVSSRKGEKVL